MLKILPVRSRRLKIVSIRNFRVLISSSDLFSGSSGEFLFPGSGITHLILPTPNSTPTGPMVSANLRFKEHQQQCIIYFQTLSHAL
jgi:hypothetical protein